MFLDIRYQLGLLQTLRMLAKTRGIAVIMSLHELDLAQKISDVVVCVKGEHIAHYGTPREIFRRELIHPLYDLKSGSYNPLFGSVEMGRSQGEAHVFVIAGGGTGIETYRALQQKGLPFITGILHQNDIDFQIANDLASEVISEEAFMRISLEVYQRALRRLKDCDTVISCLQGYGEMNERILFHVQLLCKALEKEGFSVEYNIDGMETAFIGSYGAGKPVIAILAEYDALDGLSQVSGITHQEPVISGGSGHGCGHHLLGTGSLAAAIALKQYITENKLAGTIRLDNQFPENIASTYPVQ